MGWQLAFSWYFDDSKCGSERRQHKTEVFNQFGWKTESGFCYGKFTYDNSIKSSGLPYEQKNFTVMPFSKITNLGKKKDDGQPIDITHTNNHIFILCSFLPAALFFPSLTYGKLEFAQST